MASSKDETEEEDFISLLKPINVAHPYGLIIDEPKVCGKRRLYVTRKVFVPRTGKKRLKKSEAQVSYLKGLFDKLGG